MITYNQAFDYYHAMYRFVRFLTRTQHMDYIEVERLRIWDFYFLFPDEVHNITIKQTEKDIKELKKRFIKQKNNPYNKVFDPKKIFERIKPYQLAALQCLASYGIIDKEHLVLNQVTVISDKLIKEYENKFEELTYTEQNVITLMTVHFSKISLFGSDGLKSRSKLMVSKYDSE